MTEALFASQGAPYFPFHSPGDHIEGEVVQTGMVQARKFKPKNKDGTRPQGELEFWPDQRPKMVSIITVQTDMRDPVNIPGDDGQRAVWIKGKSMETSVKAAVREAGASRKGIEVGGYFSMTFTHTTEPEFEGASPTKHYEATYTQPSQSPQDEINIVSGTATPATTSQAAQQAPAAGNGASSEPVVASVGGSQTIDLSGLNPQARAAVEAMLAKQNG